jgi:Xaa-Pro aminopeptidase
MYQSFDEVTTPEATPQRVRSLRRALKAAELSGFFVPRSDEHQNEFVPAQDERLKWLTGFTGSAGTAIVLQTGAALFVDGRYTLQARQQTDTSIFDVLEIPKAKASEWLIEKLPHGGTIGYDPRLHTIKEIERLSKRLGKAGIKLVPHETPIDRLWKDRPKAPDAPVTLHGLDFAGRSSEEKIAEVQRILKENGQSAVLLTSLDSIAWLFNIRGADIAHTPVALAFAIVPAEGRAQLFVDPAKLGDNVRAHLEEGIEINEPDTLDTRLRRFGRGRGTVRLDPETAPIRFEQILKGTSAKIAHDDDPTLLPRARKNETEIAGARAAHLRDGLAMCRFLIWLSENATKRKVDEVAAAQKLEAIRRESGRLKDISFPTISAAGPNGAVVHYRPHFSTSRRLETGSLYLIDSGGQYADGTTDVTRTVAIGRPKARMRRHYTLVLKAHIALATARFPTGTRGQDLDPIVREPLWKAGLDFDHGTGHGVGSFLMVHEGPQRISKTGSVALEPGMIVSNEPGYYREGHYGIRLENLVLVLPPEPIEDGEREMMSFETLTLVPFDRNLIDPSLLDAEEKAWLNAYHARVRKALEPLMDRHERPWLRQATAPIR